MNPRATDYGLRTTDPVLWHDLECGSYTADLPLWEELAMGAGGPVLEIGAGTGRVALHLARRGVEVVAVERDPVLAAELRERARSEALPVGVEVGDVGEISLGRAFPLIGGPMQVIQVLEGKPVRLRALERLRANLAPGGLLALALVESGDMGGARPPLPDVREHDGWVFSSLPLHVTSRQGSIKVERLRQIVSPEGELREEHASVLLQELSPAGLEAEAGEAGLSPAGRRAVPATGLHLGSTVVLLEAS